MMSLDFNRIQAIVFNVDMILYPRKDPDGGTSTVINLFRHKNIPLIFITNRDVYTKKGIIDVLNEWEFDVSFDEIWTPVDASIVYCKMHTYKTIFPLVSPEVFAAYQEYSINDKDPDLVIIGTCSEALSYQKANSVLRMITEKTELVSFNTSPFFLTHEGKNVDSGAVAALFEYVTGKKAHSVGMPDPAFLRPIVERLRISSDQLLVVGNSLDTDIVLAHTLGAQSVLVQEKQSNLPDFNDPIASPTLILETMAQLLGFIP